MAATGYNVNDPARAKAGRDALVEEARFSGGSLLSVARRRLEDWDGPVGSAIRRRHDPAQLSAILVIVDAARAIIAEADAA